MALDLKCISVRPDENPDLNQDILYVDLDAWGFAQVAAWIKECQEAETRHEILPCLVVLGTPPDEGEWSQRQAWEAQVSRLIKAGAVFWDKRAFEKAAEAWRKTAVEDHEPVVDDFSPMESPPASLEPDEVDLDLYINPPFQLSDPDFEELLRRTREPITGRED